MNTRVISAVEMCQCLLLSSIPAVDVAGGYEIIDSDPGDNTDSDEDGDDDNDNGDNSDRDENNDDADDDDDDDDDATAADSSDDRRDSNDTEFSAARQPLQGSFKTAEGITVTIVKGSIAAQKVCTSRHALLLYCHSCE